MELTPGIAIVVAAGASAAFGLSTVLQYVGTQRSAAAGAGRWGAFNQLRQRSFLLGSGLDVFGFGCAAVAVRALPLFMVQAITTSSVGVTAVLASRLLGERLRRPERLALVGVVVGLTLLALAGAEGTPPPPTLLHQAVLVALVPALALGSWLWDRRWQLHATAHGALSGAAFGFAALAARLLPAPGNAWRLLGQPLAWAALTFTLLGLLLLIAGLRRGTPTTVSAASTSVESLMPAIVGVLLLGDAARPGRWPLALVGFALSLTSALVLIRRSAAAVDRHRVDEPAVASPASPAPPALPAPPARATRPARDTRPARSGSRLWTPPLEWVPVPGGPVPWGHQLGAAFDPFRAAAVDTFGEPRANRWVDLTAVVAPDTVARGEGSGRRLGRSAAGCSTCALDGRAGRGTAWGPGADLDPAGSQPRSSDWRSG
jgi:drug/metabolite transporter (DMT)-like permease